MVKQKMLFDIKALAGDICHTFKVNSRTPIMITLYLDLIGKLNFAISYVDSGEYQVGEMLNPVYKIIDDTCDEIKFEWLSYKSDGESKQNDVVIQRLSSDDSIRFRCVIYEQFEFKSKMHIKQDGYSGYQLS